MNIFILIYEGLRMGFLGLSHGVFRNLDGIKLVKYLESLGPIFIKFGQLLSTRTDILD